MKIGTIGTGPIVHWVTAEAGKVEGVGFTAAYSRDIARARQLADTFSMDRAYDDLDALLQDDEVEFVYVASPNSLHYEQSKRALQRGKHVICEKPFTAAPWQARELRDLARQNQLFLFEAITTLYLPNYRYVRENISGVGRVRTVMLNYTQYSSRYDVLKAGEVPNVFSMDFEGGALGDLNIYNLHFAVGLFGAPQSVRYFANRQGADGVDTSGVAVLDYGDFKCSCNAAKDSRGDNFGLIQGEAGYIRIEPSVNICAAVSVHGGAAVQSAPLQDRAPWYYIFEEISDIVRRRDLDACYALLDHSVAVVEVAAAARRSAGIEFAADKKDE